ncbi:MAG: peptide chain release factor 1 [Clostridiales bacterium]|nr:peptide chain release factor 1 [Clostridiales bacterium]
MFNRLKIIKQKFDALAAAIAAPDALNDMPRRIALCKEHSSLQPVMDEYGGYLKAEADLREAEGLLRGETDAGMREFLQGEIDALAAALPKLEENLKILLLPPDPDDDKDVIVEVRAGAGGDEAGLFGSEIVRMYKMYAALKGWRVEDIDANVTELGGVKEYSFSVTGKKVFSLMKFESGVHRVQRVPETETQGRVHTSTVTVAVLPEAEDVKIEINEKDLKIDTYRSSGAGGQHVNKTESAIRITHIPTGAVVACQDERSQMKNRDKAMRALRAKLYDLQKTEADKNYSGMRKAQVGTGDRSERIRTYNFPQGRVTDHRIGLTVYNIAEFMNGNLDEMIEALRLADQTAKLAAAVTE